MKHIIKIILVASILLSNTLYAGENGNFEDNAGLTSVQAGNYQQAFQQFQEAAKKGNADALFNLGLMYNVGDYVNVDYHQALKHYKQAAALGSIKAMTNIGDLYTQALGVNQNYQEALNWYQKALNEGDILEPAANIGQIYYLGGYGVTQDYSKAFYYWTLSANAGDAESYYFLGEMCFEGIGVPKDYIQAYHYLNEAKTLGYPHAQKALKKLYAKLTPQQIQELQAGTFEKPKSNPAFEQIPATPEEIQELQTGTS
ncbi:MAG: tetratricopeptide repeat protein [Gammaproteobacteria bacterium]|nr:tetratricopeptide repeat protein [Gammaproteobacteria bacterium]